MEAKKIEPKNPDEQSALDVEQAEEIARKTMNGHWVRKTMIGHWNRKTMIGHWNRKTMNGQWH